MDAEEVRRAYDVVARAYADNFGDELDHKPFDRAWLDRVAGLAAGGRVCELGCGPGQVAAYLRARGADVLGTDISEEMVRQARRLHPAVEFRREDMLGLNLDDASLSAVVAFYAIVHFGPDQVDQALGECRRVLAPGGHLLIAFHIGDETHRVDGFLDHPVSMDFTFFEPDDIAARLEAAGLEVAEVTIRYPYPDVESPAGVPTSSPAGRPPEAVSVVVVAAPAMAAAGAQPAHDRLGEGPGDPVPAVTRAAHPEAAGGDVEGAGHAHRERPAVGRDDDGPRTVSLGGAPPVTSKWAAAVRLRMPPG